MDTAFTGLFERIREKCRRDGWYLSRVGFCHGERHRGGAGAAWGGVGALVAARRASWRVGPSIPHGWPPGPLPRIHSTPAPPRGGISAPQKPTPERWLVWGGKLDLRHTRPDHPQRHGFAYPTAGEDQLRATETALGFLLPPVLRALYAEVANGGFGPGGGIQGALGGYGSRPDESAVTIVDDYHWHCQVGYTESRYHGPVRLIDLAKTAEQWKRGSGKEDLLLPHEVWPEQLLSLEDLGCCMKACLDCKTGRVLCVAPSGNDEEYEIGPIALSLEEYLERWLCDEVLP